MPNRPPGWSQWEADIQQLLGLDATVCSGNQFNDIGDATSNDSPRDSSFRLLVDCKYTEHMSWSLRAKEVGQWMDRAMEAGKRGMMAVRLWPRGALLPRDYVVLTADDFAELYGKAKSTEEREGEPRCCGQFYEPGEEGY